VRRTTGVALAALALAFLVAHVPVLPATLEDIDSVNFALGLRDFNLFEHRPHPPGYPIYIGLGKAAVFVSERIASFPARSALEGRTLAWLSLLLGALALPLLYRLFSCLDRSDVDRLARPWDRLNLRALAATVLTVACPLFWYMAARPMSDMVGLAAALAAQVCLALAWWRQRPAPDGDRRLGPDAMGASGRMIVLGALLAGIAIGFRTQTTWLTVPLLLGIFVDRIGRGVAGAMLGSALTFGVGVLAWGVPLLVAAGGSDRYLAALGRQAGEDFAGVEMLYLNPSPRVAAFAVLRTFVYPWDSVPLAIIVLVLAAFGAVVLLIRDRRTLVAVTLLSVPYLVFHLLFQDTVFVRYALPLVPVVAFLAVRGASILGPHVGVAAAAALAVWSLSLAIPVLAAYAAEPSPTTRALDAMRQEIQKSGQPGGLAMHQAFQRPLAAEDVPVTRVLRSPPRREWLEAVRYWREGSSAPLWLLADPARTDLALVDPGSRRDRTSFAWAFNSLSTIGGMRPSAVAWHRLKAPGWFAAEGWSLTPETAGMSGLMGRGPHLGPITAWVRRRTERARVMVGGRNLTGGGGAGATFTLRLDGVEAATWDVAPGFFLRVIELPAGTLVGEGVFSRLTIESRPATEGGPPTAIEQFDLQSEGTPIWGFGEGWHEAEFDPVRGPWRWTSDRAVLVVDGATTPLELRMVVDSPLRYFDGPVHVRITAGTRTLANLMVDEGSTELSVGLSPEALASGTLAIETDQTFIPAERSGVPDHRRLGLRVLSLDLAPVNGMNVRSSSGAVP
jgi:hypothetical protein